MVKWLLKTCSVPEKIDGGPFNYCFKLSKLSKIHAIKNFGN